jgi:hypothetical protein
MTLRAPAKGVAFVMADTREAAWRMGRTLLAVLHSVGVHQVDIKDVRSFAELVQTGISDDPDLRVFECGHDGASVSEWTSAPYFLTNDSSLLGKWAELCAERAASEAHAVIRRAK